MSAVKFTRPTEEAIRFIAANMRQQDADEVWATGRNTPLIALQKSVDSSHFSLLITGDDDTPLTLLGLRVENIITDIGVPWLLSADQALNHRKEFLRQSPPVIDEMLQICSRLENWVHDKNTVSIRWLRWLGFTIDPAKPVGVDGEMFHRFHMTR